MFVAGVDPNVLVPPPNKPPVAAGAEVLPPNNPPFVGWAPNPADPKPIVKNKKFTNTSCNLGIQ